MHSKLNGMPLNHLMMMRQLFQRYNYYNGGDTKEIDQTIRIELNLSEEYMKENQDQYSFVKFDGYGVYCTVHDDPKNKDRYKNLGDLGLKWYNMKDYFPFLIIPTPGIANIWNIPLLFGKEFEITNKGKTLFTFGIELFDLNGKVRAIVTIKTIKEGRTVKGDDLNMIQKQVKNKLLFQDLLKRNKYNKIDIIKILFIEELLHKDELSDDCFKCERWTIFKKSTRCSGCGIAVYCSKECQKADWLEHKEYCKNGRLGVDRYDPYGYHDWE